MFQGVENNSVLKISKFSGTFLHEVIYNLRGGEVSGWQSGALKVLDQVRDSHVADISYHMP